jgi:hypothetical protein
MHPSAGDHSPAGKVSGKYPLSPCHPDRSEAQWRDLQLLRSSRTQFHPSQSLTFRKVAALPLSSRPEESWTFGPPKPMKNGSCSATTVHGSTALPFVISTEAYPDFLLRAASDVHMCGSL